MNKNKTNQHEPPTKTVNLSKSINFNVIENRIIEQENTRLMKKLTEIGKRKNHYSFSQRNLQTIQSQ